MKIPMQIALCFTVLLMMSCSTLKLRNATRVTHTPGVPSASRYVVYTFDLHSSKDFTLTELYLQSKANVIHIETVDCLDKESKANRSISIGKDQKIAAGDYQITFRQNAISGNTENQEITLDYMVNDQMKQKTIKVSDGGIQNDR